jgi:hypothetical protein
MAGGYTIGQACFPTCGVLQGIAMPFVVPAGPGYDLTQIDIALLALHTDRDFTIELLSDSAGLPGSSIGSWGLTGLPLNSTSIQPSQTIAGILGITLTGGEQYWLAAFADISREFGVWGLPTLFKTGPSLTSVMVPAGQQIMALCLPSVSKGTL